MAGTFLDNLKSLVGLPSSEQRAVADETAAPSSPAIAPVEQEHGVPEFNARFKALANHREKISTGRLEFLDLTRLKTNLANRWDRVQPLIMAAVQSVLRHNLGPQDFYTKLDDEVYVIAFDSKSEEHAMEICAKVAKELREKLFGEEGQLGQVDVYDIAAQVDAAQVGDAAPMELIMDVLSEKSLHAPADPSGSTYRPRGKTWAERWRTFRHYSLDRSAVGQVPITKEESSLEDMLRKTAEGVVDWRLHYAANERVLYDPEQADAAWRNKSLETAAPPTPHAEPNAKFGHGGHKAVSLKIDSVEFTYRPVWHAGKQIITSYGLDPRLLVNDRPCELNEIDELFDNVEVLATLDMLVMKRGLADLAALLRSGGRAIINLPIHRSVLDNPVKRSLVLGLLADAPSEIRKLIIVEIVDSYSGSSDWMLLSATVAACRRISYGVAMRISLDQTELSKIKSCGIELIGGDIRDQSWSETVALKKLEDFAAAAEAASLQTYVYGLDKMSLLMGAACAGFLFLSGDAISGRVPQPLGARPLSSLNLIMRGLTKQ